MRTNEIEFKSLRSAMLSVHKAEVTLASKLAAHYGKHSTRVSVAEYRQAFIAFAKSEGYCERWAGQMLVAAGIRLRGKRSDAGVARRKVKQYSAAEMVEFYSAMKKTEAAKFARFVARQS